MVARVDWVDVMSGAKREIRAYGHQEGNRTMPYPAILYTRTGDGSIMTALAVITDRWVEPLGAISGESLELEGFPDDLAGFRRYFAERYPKGGFRPLAKVLVHRLRPMTDEDVEHWRGEIWDRLYGRFA